MMVWDLWRSFSVFSQYCIVTAADPSARRESPTGPQSELPTPVLKHLSISVALKQHLRTNLFLYVAQW